MSGIKRHIAVDTQGLPHAVAVTTAEVTDRKGVLKAFARCKAGLGKVRSVLADSGYVGQPFALDIQAILGEHVTVQIAKRSELHTFKVMPQRWVVKQFGLVGETPKALEELRAQAQHQFAVRPSDPSGINALEIVNRLLKPKTREQFER